MFKYVFFSLLAVSGVSLAGDDNYLYDEASSERVKLGTPCYRFNDIDRSKLRVRSVSGQTDRWYYDVNYTQVQKMLFVIYSANKGLIKEWSYEDVSAHTKRVHWKSSEGPLSWFWDEVDDFIGQHQLQLCKSKKANIRSVK